MRILWLTNVKMPIIYKKQGIMNEINSGGWLDKISQGILENKDLSLMICYPHGKDEEGHSGHLLYKSLVYNARDMRKGKLNDKEGIEQAKKIIQKFQPDIIHIHGTEFQYHWFFAKAAKELNLAENLIVSIQGMVGVYAKHMALGIPYSLLYASTPREFIGKKNIANNIKHFIQRGKYEEAAIRITKNIIGRTTWDKACTSRINPDAKYYIGNETLRENFYTGTWNVEQCVKHRIFISQASYSVKGFHLFLEALLDIKKIYPDVMVHVAGKDLMKIGGLNGDSYARYICKLIKKYNLKDNIYFCGNLNAEQMKQELLKANVFVSASTIENSPNSVGEAMILGVPVVSSGVGGVMDLLEHKKEGLIYQSDAPYMLAYYVISIFKDRDKACFLGRAAKKRAEVTHNYEKNLNDLLDIYVKIYKGE